jgi:membrane protease YdiL (CAAX protease family)
VIVNNTKGDSSPFSLHHFSENRILIFFSLLILNLVIVNFIDFFELEKNFSVPGNENDIKESFLFFIIFIGVVVPVLEEFVFRYWIFKTFARLIPSMIILILYLILIDYDLKFNIVYIIIFGAHALYIIKNKDKGLRAAILSGFVFAVFHSVNYSLEELVAGAYLLPILFFPQFGLGMIVTYLKSFGFHYSILYHISYNSFLILYEYLRISF